MARILTIHQQLRAERATGFRPDIEGLRAIAVVAVLLYHGDIGPFDGGFVGVDVFFVVSGFLITRLLVRDLTKFGGRSLPNFWARRARRLLPASALVIVTTVLVGWVVLDPLTHQSLGRDAIAAAAFVANMVFARQDGDYFAAELAPSPLLHFWSLSVEEQFYLIWPVILLCVLRVRSGRRTALIGTIGALWVLSFIASLWLTSSNPSWAFYLLPTRAWELLSGAAVAVAAPMFASVVSRRARALLGWAGVIAIITSILFISPSSAFPGWWALWPVLGTVAVILGGVGSRLNGPGNLLSSPPMVWLGRYSYGIYLWHWPALVLADVAIGPLDFIDRSAVLVGSVALAAISYELFEDPIRHSPWLALRPRRGLLTGAAIIVSVIGVGVVAFTYPRQLDSGTVAESATIAGPVVTAPISVPSADNGPTTTIDDAVDLADVVSGLVSANAADLQEAVTASNVPSNLRPSLSNASNDKPVIYDNGCMLSDGETQPGSCIFGSASSSTTIVLFGDSHAAQWFPAMHQIAEDRGWRLESLTKAGCPTADVPTTRTDRDPECDRWRTNVIDRLAADPPDLLVMSSYRYNPNGLADEPWRSGLDATLERLRPTTSQLLILGDTPTPAPSDVPSCLASNLQNARACNASRSQSIVQGRVDLERELARKYDALFAPTGDWLCTDSECPVIYGDVLLYRDGNHISTTAAQLLAPYLEATLAAALDG
jgi:peptidoglycan/LPS O-acetylase OafA/YrhL